MWQALEYYLIIIIKYVNNFCAAEVKTNSENSNFHGISEIHFRGHLLPTENRTNGRRQLPFVFCKFKTKT
jgi:hypothetical protein